MSNKLQTIIAILSLCVAIGAWLFPVNIPSLNKDSIKENTTQQYKIEQTKLTLDGANLKTVEI